MSTTISSRMDETPDRDESAGVARSEPGGRAQRRAGAARPPGPRPELADEVKALLPDEVIDELLAGAGTEEEIAGPGGLLSPADQAAGGARDGGRADRPPGL